MGEGGWGVTSPTWTSLLPPAGDREVIVPWVGGGDAWDARRRWIVAERPPSWGWWSFSVLAAKLVEPREAEPPWPSSYFKAERGRLALLVGDLATAYTPPYEQVRVPLPPPELPRFSRVRLHRHLDGCGYVLEELLDSPCEEAVRLAVAEGLEQLDVHGATPAHRAAFEVLARYRRECQRRREEVEARARLEEVRRRDNPAGRRALAGLDPEEACRAALRTGGGMLVGFRAAGDRAVLDWRLDGRPLQSVVTLPAMSVVEAGFCLQDHRTGRRDDRLLSVEALPGVAREAVETGKLVVLRHGAGEDVDDPWTED